jgi:hypothetical protein
VDVLKESSLQFFYAIYSVYKRKSKVLLYSFPSFKLNLTCYEYLQLSA